MAPRSAKKPAPLKEARIFSSITAFMSLAAWLRMTCAASELSKRVATRFDSSLAAHVIRNQAARDMKAVMEEKMRASFKGAGFFAERGAIGGEGSAARPAFS